MTKCNHESLTIDRYCNDCGYDLIVDDREDAIRQDAFANGVDYERARIVELFKSGWYSPLGPAGLDTVMLNFIVSKGDDLTAEDIMDFVKEVIAYIEESN